MRRREFITLLGGAAAAWPLAARAQQPGKLPTIGFLGREHVFGPAANGPPLSCSDCANSVGSRVAMSRLSIAGPRGATSALPRSRPSSSGSRSMSIVTQGTPAVLAAKQATSVIPIVFAMAGNPVGNGLVASLARPGGNVTGLSNQTADLAGKRLELLREVVPGLRRLAIMANVDNPQSRWTSSEVQAAARGLGLRSRHVGNPARRGYRARLRGEQGPVEALYVAGDPLVTTNRVRVDILALGARLPTIHGNRENVEAGGLMSYGPNFPDLHRRAGDYVDKILRGTKPADLPVEQPTKFELVINLKTAKSARPRSAANAARPRRRGDRVSNCHLVAARSLIDLAASRLALRAPALRAATALTRPNRSAQRLPCGRHAVPTASDGRPTRRRHEPLR